MGDLMRLVADLLESDELFLAPGDARPFAFAVPGGAGDMAVFSEAFPSQLSHGKQSLWTIAHGIETDGVAGGEFPHPASVVHWVTVQVADPAVPTPFTIKTVFFVL
jgi:hypothetical protein